MNKVEKIRREIEKRYEYWKEKDSNSHSIESESRMSECNHLLSMIISLSDTEKDFGIKESVIPFGASDSELMEETIYIPQGFHAVIEGDKVIIRKGEESVSRAFQIDGEYTNGGFTGLLPAWIDAPSTLQPAHKWHRRNVVAVHEKNGGFRCCLIDEKVPFTFHLPENTGLASGWKNKPVSNDLEEAATKYARKQLSNPDYPTYNDEYEMECAFEAGAQWQKERDQSTIELAEDHAMLAGMEKMKEEMIDKVCKWLAKHWREYVWLTDNDIIHFGHWEHDLKKAVEE